MKKIAVTTAVAALSILSLPAWAEWSAPRVLQSHATFNTDVGPVCQVSTTDGFVFAVKLSGAFAQTVCDSAREALMQGKLGLFWNYNANSMSSCTKLAYKPKDAYTTQSVCLMDGFAVQR
jgi:hypothetical protein